MKGPKPDWFRAFLKSALRVLRKIEPFRHAGCGDAGPALWLPVVHPGSAGPYAGVIMRCHRIAASAWVNYLRKKQCCFASVPMRLEVVRCGPIADIHFLAAADQKRTRSSRRYTSQMNVADKKTGRAQQHPRRFNTFRRKQLRVCPNAAGSSCRCRRCTPTTAARDKHPWRMPTAIRRFS